MAEKNDDHNFDPERMEQSAESESAGKKNMNAGGNDSDYDGGHPSDSDPESDARIKNGEEYARRQHGKDEIDTSSFNEGSNDSDYDGGHPEDSTSDRKE